MQLSLAAARFGVPSLKASCPDRIVSRDGNQGGEMAVTVTEFEGFNLPSACLHSVVNVVGSDLCERRFTVMLPDFVQRLESRR